MQVILGDKVFHNKDNEWKYFLKNCVLLSLVVSELYTWDSLKKR